jgi:hypothetical protein
MALTHINTDNLADRHPVTESEGSESRQAVKILAMSLVGFGTENHCAGEGQQQIMSQSVIGRSQTKSGPRTTVWETLF